MALFSAMRQTLGAGSEPGSTYKAAGFANSRDGAAQALLRAAAMSAERKRMQAEQQRFVQEMGFKREMADRDSAERNADRSWRSGESAAERAARLSEGQAGREHSMALLGKQQDFSGRESALGRDHSAMMLGKQQAFQGEQGSLSRAHGMELLGLQQGFSAEQAAADRETRQAQFDATYGQNERRLGLEEQVAKGRMTRDEAELELRRQEAATNEKLKLAQLEQANPARKIEAAVPAMRLKLAAEGVAPEEIERRVAAGTGRAAAVGDGGLASPVTTLDPEIQGAMRAAKDVKAAADLFREVAPELTPVQRKELMRQFEIKFGKTPDAAGAEMLKQVTPFQEHAENIPYWQTIMPGWGIYAGGQKLYNAMTREGGQSAEDAKRRAATLQGLGGL